MYHILYIGVCENKQMANTDNKHVMKDNQFAVLHIYLRELHGRYRRYISRLYSSYICIPCVPKLLVNHSCYLLTKHGYT